VTEQDRKTLVAKYKDGYRAVAEALAGAEARELDARPAPNKWTAREIVHHLADSEMTSAIRLRLLVAEDGVAIKGYDQEAFAKKLFYDRPHEASLEAFKYARETTGQILDRLSPADWTRAGTHTEVGRFTVETWLSIYAAHAHDHADQIRRARAAASKAGSAL
jgi:hypothetical protein